jgi:hypothetical protein
MRSGTPLFREQNTPLKSLAIPAEMPEALSINGLWRLTPLTAVSATKGLPQQVTNGAGPVPHGSGAVIARAHDYAKSEFTRERYVSNLVRR